MKRSKELGKIFRLTVILIVLQLYFQLLMLTNTMIASGLLEQLTGDLVRIFQATINSV
ncbi:hypothetical protein [Methanosarcina sp. WWM596]|uniref:hypothetical protein n=1 Tax=Methanosarcina sp. WWM596 TaxID=1434103 RepID=UPI000B310794|nr:hypothetical protein [Methanosarcina sp. WWM596]